MNMGSMTPARLLWQPSELRYLAAGRVFQGIPALERSVGGRLFASWYTGTDGEKPGNFVLVEKSDDDGASWTDGWLVIEHEDPNVRCFDECLWQAPDGQLWIFWAQSEYGQFDGRVGVWEIHTANADDERPDFTPPRRIANGIMLNKPTVLKNGDWLMPCSLWSTAFAKIAGPGHPELEGEIGANVYISHDRGETFEHLSCVEMPNRVFDEHSVIELTDGRLWMLTRTVNGLGQAFSTDGGKTWENIGPSGHSGPNSRAFITRLSTGDLLLVNHMNPTNVISDKAWKRRDNLMAMLSKDDGQTWIGGLMLDVRPEISYPDGFEAPDGRIYVIYDRERTKAREILMAVFRPEDVLEGYMVSPDARMRVLINRATGVKQETETL